MLAYGLDLSGLGLPGSASGVRPTRTSWPSVVLHGREGASPSTTSWHVEEDRVRLDVAEGFSVEVRRRPDLHAQVVSPAALEPATLLHPVASFVGVVAARWSGRLALHAVAVLLGGRAWVLLAESEGGKSTLAAAFEARGLPVLADDMVVLEDRVVLAGPRTCDLRQEAAAALPAQDLAEVGWRRRWRLGLSDAPLETELGGFVGLSWSDHLDVQVPTTSQRLAHLERAVATASPANPLDFLDLLGERWFTLERPRSFALLDEVVDLLVGLADGQPTA